MVGMLYITNVSVVQIIIYKYQHKIEDKNLIIYFQKIKLENRFDNRPQIQEFLKINYKI